MQSENIAVSLPSKSRNKCLTSHPTTHPKNYKNMKTTLKSMMVIGMMILGTVTTFGKTTTNVDKHIVSHNAANTVVVVHSTKKPCMLRHIHDSRCGGAPNGQKVFPGMTNKVRNHIIKGNHRFNRHGVCTKCDLTASQIHHIEHEMGIKHTVPMKSYRR